MTVFSSVCYRNADRRLVHCLICFKPMEALSTHLSRVCMKDKSPAERQAEVVKAKTSTKLWTREGRTWDYLQLCGLCPHEPSRRAFVKELRRRGFFISNDPGDTNKVEEEVSLTSAPRSTTEPQENSEERPHRHCSESEESSSSDHSWQK